jgi:hypothetical protein
MGQICFFCSAEDELADEGLFGAPVSLDNFELV